MNKILNDSGIALLMAILFTLIINGIAMTLFVTTSGELSSANSQAVSMDTFNLAEAGLNIGLLRIKILMEANDPIDPSVPFSKSPFKLTSESGVGSPTLTLAEYKYFDLINRTELDASALASIQSGYIDTASQTYSRSIEGFFAPESSNPDLISAYLTGAEPVYYSLLDTGESTILRGWRVFLSNDNDGDDKTATLTSIGYLLDVTNGVLYKKQVEASIYIHGMDLGKKPDPSGQVTSSETGARTGRFRVSSDLGQPVTSHDLR